MNYLGHLYFSNNDTQLMLANLYGDFVKGSNLEAHTVGVQAGIRLHRSIDNFIDTHSDVLQLKRILYEDLPKVSGVAIDLFFDHLLAKNWSEFHDLSLTEFLNRFYTCELPITANFTSEFLNFIDAMRTHNWISHYPTEYGLRKSCEGVSAKISFPNHLKDGHLVFKKHEEEITECFKKYMHDALEYFKVKPV